MTKKSKRTPLKKQQIAVPKTEKPNIFSNKTLIRVSYVFFLIICAGVSVCTLFIIETKESAFELALIENNPVYITPQEPVVPFPLGVNPLTQAIEENPAVATFFEMHITSTDRHPSKVGWWYKNITAKLARLDWYQNLASPISRILIAEPGERREEVVDHFGDILRWDTAERNMFVSLVASSSPQLYEGKFFPGRYVVEKDATPETVANIITKGFYEHIASRYTDEIARVVPLNDALTIASLLEREAYDFEDMRFISGVIWNRLFEDMHLQIDASLQYARANAGDQLWWPVPEPKDKYIDSVFNTYEHKGLPPSPIANPSPEALLAALNPKATECIFYFHDSDGAFHCTKTYEEHVALLKKYYGRGR